MTHRTRRQFLEQSMFATASALAAGSLLGGKTAWADDAEQPASRSPSEKLGVVVVGVRGRGGEHINQFSNRSGVEIRAVCDVDDSVGQRTADNLTKQFERRVAFERDLRKVLEDPAIDIVSIATPNHLHSIQAIWAMQAGKDVYVEKPVSHNVSEGRRAVQAARKYNRICQTGTQSRSSKALDEAMQFLQKGELGDLKVARALCYKRRGSIGPKGDYPVPAGIDYNLWCGPAPMDPVTRRQFHYDWHWIWEYGNGDLGNQGIHQMDIARRGLGVDTLCNHVASYGGRFGYEDAGETANTQICVYDYGDKSLVFEVRGLETKPYKAQMVGNVFETTEGYLVVPASYNAATAFDRDGKVVKQFNGGGDHFGNFLKAVRSRKQSDLTADILEGHLSSALCHLGNISYRLGEDIAFGEAAEKVSEWKSQDNARETFDRTREHLQANKVELDAMKLTLGPMLAFDPEKEIFPGNAAATNMCSRECRAPFIVPTEADL